MVRTRREIHVVDTTPTTTETPAALLDVREVAKLLGCSSRHVYRLTDLGAMPKPIKLGALVRWSRQTIHQWIANGCPRERTNTGR